MSKLLTTLRNERCAEERHDLQLESRTIRAGHLEHPYIVPHHSDPCVWTAVHLNIPKYQKASEATWRKVLWLVTALLAPELVGYECLFGFRLR